MAGPRTAADAAAAHQAERSALAAAAALALARQWAGIDPAQIAQSWTQQLPAALAVLTAAQMASARTADPYVATVLAAEGQALAAEFTVAAAAFAGQAADGRDLFDLLYLPVVTTLQAIRAGAPVQGALQAGLLQLETIAQTEVADAGRVADGVAITKEPAVGRYVRLVVGATCSRCIILAGRVYRWSQGFERHPNCDCIMIPAVSAEAAGLVQSPRRVYDAMTPEQRTAAGWSRAEQAAIADGADIAAVTNIHRGGLYTAGGRRFTYEATAGRRRPRITPEQIYRDAAGERGEAVRLLRLHGYIR